MKLIVDEESEQKALIIGLSGLWACEWSDAFSQRADDFLISQQLYAQLKGWA